MKRKFLAKAITLGLMLAVPLGAQAKDQNGNAEGIIVNNVDNQTVTADADLNIDINKPVDYFANINGAHAAVVGLGVVKQSVDLSSLTITNTVTNDFGNDGVDKNVHTEVTGLSNLAGTVHVKNDINIKLSGTDNRVKVNDNGEEKKPTLVFLVSELKVI